jgi:hypothetical protein
VYATHKSLQESESVGVVPDVIQVPVPSSHALLAVPALEVTVVEPVHYPFAPAVAEAALVVSLNNVAQSSAIFDAPKAAYHQR